MPAKGGPTDWPAVASQAPLCAKCSHDRRVFQASCLVPQCCPWGQPIAHVLPGQCGEALEFQVLSGTPQSMSAPVCMALAPKRVGQQGLGWPSGRQKGSEPRGTCAQQSPRQDAW